MSIQIYYYDIQALLNRIQYESMKKAKNIKSEAGKSQVDDMAINDEDLVFAKKLLKDVSGKVFNALSPYSRGLEELEEPLVPFEFDVTYEEVEGQLVYRVEWPEKFDVNISTLIDQSVENLLIEGTKEKFLEKIGIPNEAEANAYKREYAQLLGYLARRKGYVRPYKQY